jgi:hypothetical protein
MHIGFTGSGNFNNIKSFARKFSRGDFLGDLDKWGQDGVAALSAATPVRTGLASESWDYEIIDDAKRPGIQWINTDIESGLEVVILIQYGHATGTGGYVQGRDFINPAMQPIFDEIQESIWEKVNNA